MARFGNSGVSSLISAATSAYNKNQTLNDSLAQYQWELSPKDQNAFDTYSSYLGDRITKTTNDPSKNLTYEKALTTAHKGFTSAEIQRASTQVDYGNIDNTQKYGIVSQLRDAALQNGDEATAQSLEAKMAGLSVTIQNQQAAAQAANDRASSKAATANKKGVDQAAAAFDQQLRLAQEAVDRGQMSVQDFQKFQGEAMTTKAQFLTDAANGKYGDLGPTQSDYHDKATTLTSSPQYLDAQKYYSQAANGQPTKFLDVNPANRDEQGMIGVTKDLPGQRVVQNSDGSFSNTYLGGFQDKVGADGKSLATPQSRQGFIDSGNPYIFNNVIQAGQAKGTGGVASPVGSQIIADPANPGAYFVMDQNGNKHYVSTDPNAALQRSQEPIIPGKTDQPVDTSLVGSNVNELKNTAAAHTTTSSALLGGVLGAAALGPAGAIAGGALGAASNFIGSALGANQHIQDRAQAQEALAKAQAAQKAYTTALATKQAAVNTAPPAVKAQLPTVLPAKGQIYYPGIGRPGAQNGATRALNNAPAPSAPQTVKTTALVDNLMGYSPTNGF